MQCDCLLHETLKLDNTLNHDAHQAHSCVLSTELKKRPVHRFRNVSPGNCYFLRPRSAHHLNEEGYPSASLAGYTLRKITMMSGDVFGLVSETVVPLHTVRFSCALATRRKPATKVLTLNATAAVTN